MELWIIVSLVLVVVNWVVVSVYAIDCTPISQSFTIKTEQDVSDITQCSQFNGHLVIAADGPQDIALDGIKVIAGNIDVEYVANLRSLSSTSLEAAWSITLNQLPVLSSLNFPVLKNFSSLKWYNLPSLEESTIATGAIEGEIQEITIVNTSLKSLEWLKWPIGSQLNISHNANLESFAIPYNTINAGSALTFTNNANLDTLNVSNLVGSYGGLQVSSNPNITELGFDNLETIGGFVQLSGDFVTISMPNLKTINGALRVESTNDIAAFCANLQEEKLTGHYDCTPNVQKDTTASATATTSSVPTPSATYPGNPEPAAPRSGLSVGVKVGIAIAVVLLVIVALLFGFFCLRRQTRAKVREIEQKPIEPDPVVAAEPDNINPYFAKAELESPVIKVEMAGEMERQELSAVVPQELETGHGASEVDTPVSPATSWLSARSDAPLVRHELPA